MPRASSPIACRMDALTPAERARRAELFARVGAAVEAIDDLPDGFALRLSRSTETWMAAAEFVALEARCCPFLSLELRCEEEEGPLRLLLTGRPGVKEFLAAELRLSQTGGTG